MGILPRPILMGAAANAVMRSSRKYHYIPYGIIACRDCQFQRAARVVVALSKL